MVWSGSIATAESANVMVHSVPPALLSMFCSLPNVEVSTVGHLADQL